MIIDPGLRLWGSERALAATLKALTESWERVVLATPSGAELAEEVRDFPDRYGPVEIVDAPIGNLHRKGRGARLWALVALARLALRLRPSRIYLNQAGLARLLAPVCRALGIPLVIHVRLIEDIARVTPMRGTSRSPLDLIFISDAMADAAGDVELPSGTRWHKAYDPYHLTPEHAPLPQKALFACVGRLSRGKGMHLLVEALALPDLAEARLDIYGAGVEGDDYPERLAEQARGLAGRVRLIGFHHDMIQRLAAYRFLVLTSRYETLGRVVMEGWEAGLVPIVYAGSGGAAEVVQKSGGGLSFEDWRADSLAQTLVVAQQMSPETHRAMVTAGRQWIADELGLARYRTALSGALF